MCNIDSKPFLVLNEKKIREDENWTLIFSVNINIQIYCFLGSHKDEEEQAV